MVTVHKSGEVNLQSPIRNIEEHQDVIAPAYLEAWRDASRYASPRRYLHGGVEVTVEMDWAAVARRIIDNLDALKQHGSSTLPSKWSARLSRDLKVSVTVTLRGSNRWTSLPYYVPFLINYHVSNVFLAMNIAAPGSADFSNFGVHVEDFDNTSGVDLSGYDYEYAWTASLDGAWPPVATVPVARCFEWLAPLERRLVHVARTPHERASLSMLQIAKLDSSPTSAIWIWCALESPFRTTHGQIFAQVHDQVCRLLRANEGQASSLKKSLRALYGLRSSFTHGNLPVVHPCSIDELDEGVDDEMGRYVDAHLNGVRVLLACVQALVRRK